VKRLREIRRCRLISGETVEGQTPTRTPTTGDTSRAKRRNLLSQNAQDGLDLLEAARAAQG